MCTNFSPARSLRLFSITTLFHIQATTLCAKKNAYVQAQMRSPNKIDEQNVK